MLNQFELHPDRLTTTDEKGHRVFLFTADVRGFFRRWRTRVQLVLILIFLLLPWLKVGGHQALLLDVVQRRFAIFGLSLRAHNAPLIFFVFTAAAFALLFVTAVWGRIWCGWACPQTVFIDGVFRRIERWVEGPALDRRRLATSPWTAAKIIRRSGKYSLYLLCAGVLTHSFLAYFVGTEQLMAMMRTPPQENWLSFLFILTSTAIVFFDFAWFREQFCIIVCPYGRLQSVLMDGNSKIIRYDPDRGEPRATPAAKAAAKSSSSRLGDCVNCYRCVQVCPTGIDIRRGLQLECIACTSCIDACDEVMRKIKKPTGLIRYDSLQRPTTPSRARLSPRALIYLGLCLLSILSLTAALAYMKPVDITILRAKDEPYTVLNQATDQPSVHNHFRLEISNQSHSSHRLSIALAPSENPRVRIIMAERAITIGVGSSRRVDIFMQFPQELLIKGQKQIKINIIDLDMSTNSTIQLEKEVTLVGPFS